MLQKQTIRLSVAGPSVGSTKTNNNNNNIPNTPNNNNNNTNNTNKTNEMGHKQYMRVGQTAKNSLFGVDRRSAPSSNGTPLQMLISQQGKFNHGKSFFSFL